MNIDVPKLKSDLQKKHNEFRDNFKGITDKVVADRQFYVHATMAKISYICNLLIEVGSIDDIRSLPTHSESYLHIELAKKGHIDSIHIMTDGQIIVLENSNFEIYTDFMTPYRQKFYIDEGIENFDWENFAYVVLDAIHAMIYRRKESTIARFESGLND